MVRAKRAMTSMGMATSSGLAFRSLIHGHHPVQPPCSHPPVSFRGEWGERQREKQRGAAYGCAKITSSEVTWTNTTNNLNSHKRQAFCHARRPKPKNPNNLTAPTSTPTPHPLQKSAPLIQPGRSALRALPCHMMYCILVKNLTTRYTHTRTS